MKYLKKIISRTTIITLCLISTVVFANSALSNLHSTKNHLNPPTKKSSDSRAANYYPTEIKVVNHSSRVVYVTVPGTEIYNDTLWSGETEFIYSDIFFDAVRVILKDQWGTFFDSYVLNHTTLYVETDFDGTEKPKLRASAS
jgi:hypothetical protein